MQGWAIASAAAGVAAAGVAGYFVSRAIARNDDSKVREAQTFFPARERPR